MEQPGPANGTVEHDERHVCAQCAARIAELEQELGSARQRLFDLESDVGAAVTLLQRSG